MKVLIVGGDSMIGQRIQQRLIIHHEVYSTSRRDGAKFFLDLLSGETHLPPDASFDCVIHCAASFEPNTFEGASVNEQVNSTGAFHVAKLAVQTGCRLVINLSSISTMKHPDNGYFGSYGLSKQHGDENLQWACEQHGIDYVSLLPSQVYDETGDFRRHQQMLYRILDLARAGNEVVLFGSRDVLRNFLHVDDLAEVIVRVIDNPVTGRYPCVSPWTQPLSEVARLAFAAFDQPASVVFDRSKPDLPTVYIPSNTSLYDKIDFEPIITLEKGFRQYRRYLADHAS